MAAKPTTAELTPDTSVAQAGSTSAVSQTTDAATLAAIDTSGYILPSIKVPGRRGRKPKEFQPENDEVAALNVVERAELKAVDKDVRQIITRAAEFATDSPEPAPEDLYTDVLK